MNASSDELCYFEFNIKLYFKKLEIIEKMCHWEGKNKQWQKTIRASGENIDKPTGHHNQNIWLELPVSGNVIRVHQRASVISLPYHHKLRDKSF